MNSCLTDDYFVSCNSQYNIVTRVYRVTKNKWNSSSSRYGKRAWIKKSYSDSRCITLPKKTLKDIKESGKVAVIQLKRNQKTVYEELEDWLKDEISDSDAESLDVARNRQERRCVEIFKHDSLRQDLCDEWDNLINEIVRCTRFRRVWDTKLQDWEESFEQCYYLSTASHSAENYLKIVRGHRRIENSEHYVRDVSFQEDKSRIRKNPWSLAILRSMALNILRAKGIENISEARKENGFSLNILMEKFGFLLT